jgi:hypothetical protein
MADGSAAPKRRKMPAQRPHTSEQVVATPWEFVDALEHRFGKLDWDLCASADNCVVRNVNGTRSSQFFSKEENSLAQDWSAIGGNLYCNPEFGLISKFLEKAVAEASPTSRVFMLTPASIDANWWWEFVRPHAITYALDRIRFVGQPHVHPKGLALHLIGMGATGMGRWRWTKEIAKR